MFLVQIQGLVLGRNQGGHSYEAELQIGKVKLFTVLRNPLSDLLRTNLKVTQMTLCISCFSVHKQPVEGWLADFGLPFSKSEMSFKGCPLILQPSWQNEVSSDKPSASACQLFVLRTASVITFRYHFQLCDFYNHFIKREPCSRWNDIHKAKWTKSL